MLADYVLALLRHDGDEQTVRQLCETEIPDFLKEDSTIFVRDVFEAIHYKSYIPGYVPPRRPSAPFAPPTGPSISVPAYGSLGVGIGPPVGAPSGPGLQNGSRKRSYNDRGEGDAQFQGGDMNGRSFKQPRRGGPGMGRGGFESFNPGVGRGGRPPPMALQNMPQYPNMPGPGRSGPQGFDPNMAMAGMPSPPPGLPPLDPNNPLAAILAMQAMGVPIPNLPGFPPGGSPVNGGFPRPKNPRCIDYDQKGFCAKGNTCQFEHGEHSIWVPPVKRQDEYDPTNSGIVNRGGFNSRGGDRGRGRGVPHNGGHFSSPARRGGRSEFSSDRQNYDKSNTTIVVENIPEEKFDPEAVKAFFSEFGNILDVDMRPYKRLAIVKYDDWNSAKAAYNSPKVIFDNRFVKVYWYINQESLPHPPATSANGTPKNGSVSGTPGPANLKTEPRIDIEEFKQRQEEVQKAHEEKQKKTQEMESQKKELEKRHEELLKRQAEEKRKLMEKIAAKTGKSTTPPIKQGNGSPAPSDPKAVETDRLKAQLAALEAEAHSLGLPTDPYAADESSWAPRGRGRGRGGYRGRGAYVPRVFRGGYRGRGAAPFVLGGRSFNLDNRPKKIGLTGVDFSDPAKDESLREYLLVSPFLSFHFSLWYFY